LPNKITALIMRRVGRQLDRRPRSFEMSPNDRITIRRISLVNFVASILLVALLLLLYTAPKFITFSNQALRKGDVKLFDNDFRQKEYEKCSFRSYPPNRYYELSKPLKDQPDFLSKAFYIRGQLPVILNMPIQTAPSKICLDTSEWEKGIKDASHRPFTDGHNPSVVSLSPYPFGKTNQAIPRLNSTQTKPLQELFGDLDDKFISVTVFGNGQCAWKMTKEQREHYDFSPMQKAPSYRTVLAIHDKDFDITISQSTLLLEQDAEWGTTRPHQRVKMQNEGSAYTRSIQQFDDPRFFFHAGSLWILYRNGPKFGYEDQIHNRVYFEKNQDDTGFVAFIKASETIKLCCGRNIALINEPKETEDIMQSPLKALTWVDPVTVVDVDLSILATATTPARHRRVLGNLPKSNIHGTNGYMVPLESTNEWLGIAHFHRPENSRDTSDYALHGHHYTHAFFTIQTTNNQNEFRLKRISNEFVFAAISPPSIEPDADIIQFASGIDRVGSDLDGTLIISYGINDCEGAVFTIFMKEVQSLLLEVNENEEVLHLMRTIVTV